MYVKLYRNAILLLLWTLLLWQVSPAEAQDDEVDSIADTSSDVSPNVSAQLLWQLEFEREIVGERVLDDGRLLVMTDSAGCFLVDTKTGSVSWHLVDSGGVRSVEFLPVPGKQIVLSLESRNHPEADHRAHRIVDHFFNTISVIDLNTGQRLWDGSRFGYVSVKGLYYLEQIDAVLLYGRDTGNTHWAVAASLQTGELLWRNDDLFGGARPALTENLQGEDFLNGQQPPLIDSDTSMIVFMDKEAIRKFSLKTGQLIWKTQVDAGETPSLDRGYAPALLSPGRDVAYFPMEKSLVAILTNDGRPLWDSLPELKGRVYQIELVDRGILLRGGGNPDKPGGHDYLSLLDFKTGRHLWERPFTKLSHQFTSNFLVDSGQALVYTHRKVYRVALADGSFSELVKKVNVKTKEVRPQLERRSGNYLIAGANNLALLSPNGDSLFSVCHKAPGASFGAIMGAIAIGMMTSLGSGGMFYIMPVVGPIAIAKTSNDYQYIVTNVTDADGKKPGLVKVSRDTGKTMAAIKLGDRTPMFAADQNNGRLFYVRDGVHLECYDF